MINTDISPDVQALTDRLAAVPIGETVDYAALSAVIGRDIREVRYLVLAAMRKAIKDHGAAFANERKVGYRRLAPGEASKVGATARARIRRTARKSFKTISAMVAGANDMDDAARLAASREQSTLGLIAHLSRNASMPEAPENGKPEPVAITARRALEKMGSSI